MTWLLFFVLATLSGWLITWLILRKRTAELAAKNYHLNMIRKAARAANGGIYIYNAQNKETYWDTNTIRMFGVAGTGRIIEHGMWEGILHPEDRQAAIQTMNKVLSSSTLFFDQSYRIIRGDGEIRWIEGSGYVTRDEKNRPIEITGLHFDITPQVQQNIALEKSKYEAERAMEAKAQFLANMSHEIRTPMNAIIGMIELLSSELVTPVQRRYVLTLQNSSEVLLRIINDVLDVSKIEAGKLQLERKNFNLRNILHQCFSVHSHMSEQKNILLTGYVDSSVPIEIQADSTRLQQVIINLLSNAFKFTHEGNIQLRVSCTDEGCLYFQISDTGIGIADENREKLFDRFTQADDSTTRKFGGTGLGLAIVKQIVELWHGNVWVTSQPQQGATFHFTLPIEEPTVRISSIKGKYLLASRFKTLFEVWQQVDNAPKVIWVNTLDDLKNTLANETINFLIIEQRFPELSGDKVIAWCKENYPKISTTLIGFENIVGAAREDERIDDFLAKPFFINQIWDTQFTDTPKNRSQVPQQRTDFQHLNVLCVDDNASNLIVLSGLLKRFGISSKQALSGQEALNIIEQEDFDLILMDYEMPEMDGPETTRQILSIKPMLIVGLSAHTGEVFKNKAEASGMRNFLRKPIRARELAHLLNEHFDSAETFQD
jgi:PAS domain S-box-containing protein